ncbi:MAG: sialidase family protein [Candidatus Sumerlaeota bacterium]|nr:sialidase family protein [Candidatus Sumerlaeota bacterium]
MRCCIEAMLICGCVIPLAVEAVEPVIIKWEAAVPAAGAKALVQTADGALLTARSNHYTTGVEIAAYRSPPPGDNGTSWAQAGIVARDNDSTADLGDSAMAVLKSGEVLCCFRRNNYRHRPVEEHSYAIELSASRDNGKTWRFHSTVMDSKGTTGGLWASFLLERSDGALQCYYDDEVTPWREGFARHQWAQMKTWAPDKRAWVNPVTVSRAHNPAHLSRDGMCSVVELPAASGGRLVCALESVKIDPPCKGNVRCVTSDDGGKTWSWQKEERRILYQPKDVNYNSLAPWMIRLSDGTLLCVFVTDEARATPDTPATARLDEDLKCVFSFDGGVTWSEKAQTISADHPCYLPGVIELTRGPLKGHVMVLYVAKSGLMNSTGAVVSQAKENARPARDNGKTWR